MEAAKAAPSTPMDGRGKGGGGGLKRVPKVRRMESDAMNMYEVCQYLASAGDHVSGLAGSRAGSPSVPRTNSPCLGLGTLVSRSFE